MSTVHDQMDAYTALRIEFVKAFFTSPDTPIHTPGHPFKTQPVCRVIADQMVLDEGFRRTFIPLLRLVVLCAEGQNPTLRAIAHAWLNERAKEHATYHQDDQVQAELDGIGTESALPTYIIGSAL